MIRITVFTFLVWWKGIWPVGSTSIDSWKPYWIENSSHSCLEALWEWFHVYLKFIIVIKSIYAQIFIKKTTVPIHSVCIMIIHCYPHHIYISEAGHLRVVKAWGSYLLGPYRFESRTNDGRVRVVSAGFIIAVITGVITGSYCYLPFWKFA